MGKTIKVRCNGPGKHVNEIDLEDALSETTILRSTEFSSPSLPERIVLRCHDCAEGKVILTRAIIEDARQRNPLR